MKAVCFPDVEFKFFRRKYKNNDITFKSIADLRKELPSQDTLSTLQRIKSYVLHRKFPSQDTLSTLKLLKSFVKKIRNKKEKADLVKIFLNVCLILKSSFNTF